MVWGFLMTGSKKERRRTWEANERARLSRKICENAPVYLARSMVLRTLGFSSYQEYLDSLLWKRIRARALKGTGGTCRICLGLARQVHHRDYGLDTLSGQRLDGLIPVCGGCHWRIEFTRHRNKRTFYSAQVYCNRMIRKADRRRGKPKTTTGAPLSLDAMIKKYATPGGYNR